jgi:streptomycin 6-kinase
MKIPERLAINVRDVHGETGAAWLARLPSILEECSRDWSLTLGAPFEAASFNYVTPARRDDGSEAVLKVGVPHREFTTEFEALRAFDGRGSVRLLEGDAERGVMLLERALPGTPVSQLGDDAKATSALTSVMRGLWRVVAADHPFPTVADWAGGLAKLRREFGGGTGPFPPEIVDAAERTFDDLLSSSPAPRLLHGDLHHDNVLAAGRRPWLAVDPKGVVGDPAYETAAMLRNPVGWLPHQDDPSRILRRRVDQLAEGLGLDRARVTGWGFAQTVLAAWWTWEDHGRYDEAGMACAEQVLALHRESG